MGFGVCLMERSLRFSMSTQSIIFVMAPSALERLQEGECGVSMVWFCELGYAHLAARGQLANVGLPVETVSL